MPICQHVMIIIYPDDIDGSITSDVPKEGNTIKHKEGVRGGSELWFRYRDCLISYTPILDNYGCCGVWYLVTLSSSLR